MATLSSQNQKTRSRKINLVKIRSAKRLRLFTSLGSNTYEKLVDFFVERFAVDGTYYTLVTGSLVTNSFKYDVTTKKLTFKTNGTNPESVYSIATFLHFYSNFPVVLPYDLNTGSLVEFEPRIQSYGSIKLELDSENTGIALESDSSISLENNDRYFDAIFDTHIWENKEVEIYYWYENLLPSQAKFTYRGLIQDKSFDSKSVKFQIKDNFLVLRNNLQLNLFDETDGSYDDNLYLKPKRRIYGKVNKLKVTGVDKLKKSFTGTGTITGVSSLNTIVGVGTSFLTEVCPEDKVVVTLTSGEDKEYKVQEVIDNNNLELSEIVDVAFSGVTYKISTDKYSKYFNRKWNIAGHKLVELSTSITSIVDPATFEVSTIEGYEVGDLVVINGLKYTIIRAYSNILVMNQNVIPTPAISDLIYKVPCYKAYWGLKELTFKVDYEINNTASNAELVIYDSAEANVILPILTEVVLVFTNGSRIITCTTSTDLSKIFTTRDLIKPNSITYFNYYEILSISPTEIVIRSPFIDPNITINGSHKKMEYIADDSVVAVDCIGIGDYSDNWIRYPSQIVEDILLHDAIQSVDSASFLEARSDAEFKVSCYFPENIGDESPLIRDCITKVNKSVFGSLYYNNNFEFKYSILNSNKPESIFTLLEDDVLSYSVSTKNRIINRAKINYNPHADLISGDTTFDALVATSDFVDKLIGYSKEEILDTILYSPSDAQIILNRYLFFNSLTNSIVKIKAKLNLAEINLNDPIQLEFDRIYQRYSGGDKLKIGLVNYIEKTEYDCMIQVNDLGGVLNRVPSIAPNTLVDIGSSANQEIAKFGFIVDNINETPDNTEKYLGSNLIG
jgi:hypothetical protein